jgi:hypothetical protein
MNCRRADQLFSAGWEDELTLVEREALESHMASCTACRVAYDEFVRVMEAVQGLPKMEAGSEFVEGVWSRIRAVDAPRARGVRLTWSWASFQPALAAAACLVVVGGAVVYLQSHNPSRSVANPSPVTEHRQAPSPVAMAPAPEDEKPTLAPRKAMRPEAVEPAPAKQVTTAPEKLADAPANNSPASVPAEQNLHVRGGRAESLGLEVASRQDTIAPTDSLFDHSYDFEFALDPVRLSKSGKGKLSPSRPMPTEAQGKPAKVTF